MAIYTPLSNDDADRITREHGLGAASAVVGIPAGSVNSNFFVDCRTRRVFVRIYEEQEVDGVEFEWALLDHLTQSGLPVPLRVAGPGPGELRVAGKPTAVFEAVGGEEVCQRMVTPERAAAVGRILALAHDAAKTFERRREGRFTLSDVGRRLATIAALERPELREAVGVLEQTMGRIEQDWPRDLPGGVVHGDLFRDNVRWDASEIVCVLDWESAADGAFVYDLAVTALAWCFGDSLEPALIEAMKDAYTAERPFSAQEEAAWPLALVVAATRFTVTRITDFHLREGSAQVKKDWRRYYQRLLAVR